MNERSIFEAAIEKNSPQERAAYLDAACGQDVKLRDRVDLLLREYNAPDPFLDAPPSELARTVSTLEVAEQVGSMIGPYKLREQIGEGGFGVVYVAEQEQPVSRKVALKIIKPGMDTKDVIARFEAERQALAMMDHPNIAKVLEAGATESGRPYFVMELVKGVSITDFCDQQKLSTRERLRLFVDVCRAVQHAHQKGIIHRDLKPSNVMVTMRDDRAIPKVIDFGVSKALSHKLTDKTVYTAYGQMIGTPLYMSPEQAQMNEIDVDTRSDVYSLGVLLYELLTGSTPFDKQTLKQAGFDEMRRIIREDEPPRPSDRISTLQAEALSTLSAQRNIDPHRFSRQVQGELDWIAMRALEKDRTRRYESASAFAADIERYLNDEPVEACPPTAVYRLKKFTRRNKATLVTLVLVATSLLVGTAISLWQAKEANDARELADRRFTDADSARKLAADRLVFANKRLEGETKARAEADEQRKLAQQNFDKAQATVDEYLTRISQETLFNEPGLQPLRKDLLELALKYYQEFIEQAGDNPAVKAELAKAYFRVGSITKRIGSAQDAIQAYQAALDIRETLVADYPEIHEYQDNLATSYNNLASLYRRKGQTEQSLALFQKAITIKEELAKQNPEVHDYQSRLATSYNNLALLHGSIGQDEQSLALFQKAITIKEELAKQNPEVHNYQSRLAISYNYLAGLYRRKGQTEQAMALIEKAITIKEELAKQNPEVHDYQSSLAASYNNLAILYQRKGQTEQALALIEKAITIQEKLAKQNPEVHDYQSYLAGSYNNLALQYRRKGQDEQSLALFQKAITIKEELAKQNPEVHDYQSSLASSYNNLALLHESIGQDEQSLALFQKAITILEELAKKNPEVPVYQSKLANSYNNLAYLYQRKGQTEQSLALFQKAITIKEELARQNPEAYKYQFSLVSSYNNLAGLYIKMGQTEQSLALIKKAIEISEKRVAENPAMLIHRSQLWRSYMQLALLQKQVGKEDETLATYQKAAECLMAIPEQKRTVADWGHLGQVLYKVGRWKESRQAFEKGIELRGETGPTMEMGPRWWHLTVLLARAGETEKARSYYDQLVKRIKRESTQLQYRNQRHPLPCRSRQTPRHPGGGGKARGQDSGVRSQ